MIAITGPEYEMMKQFIENSCGIHLENGKEYLIETRLSDLVIENGCTSFKEFHDKAKKDVKGDLHDRIIDAMTTNETLWFRDESAWTFIKEKEIPELIAMAESGKKVRIWSSAASTGQEIYSLLMLLNEELSAKNKTDLLDRFELVGSDISSSALFLAISAKYNQMSMSRGMPDYFKKKYFIQTGNVWAFDESLKKRVKFKRFNLQNDISILGTWDFILCRYVAIYFSDKFKTDLFKKFSKSLLPNGILLLGATESLRAYSTDFNIETYKNTVVNRRK